MAQSKDTGLGGRLASRVYEQVYAAHNKEDKIDLQQNTVTKTEEAANDAVEAARTRSAAPCNVVQGYIQEWLLERRLTAAQM